MSDDFRGAGLRQQWWIQDLPKVAADYGECAEREPKRGSGAEPPAGARGRAPAKGQSLLSIFTQKSGQKLRI